MAHEKTERNANLVADRESKLTLGQLSRKYQIRPSTVHKIIENAAKPKPENIVYYRLRGLGERGERYLEANKIDPQTTLFVRLKPKEAPDKAIIKRLKRRLQRRHIAQEEAHRGVSQMRVSILRRDRCAPTQFFTDAELDVIWWRP